MERACLSGPSHCRHFDLSRLDNVRDPADRSRDEWRSHCVMLRLGSGAIPPAAIPEGGIDPRYSPSCPARHRPAAIKRTMAVTARSAISRPTIRIMPVPRVDRGATWSSSLRLRERRVRSERANGSPGTVPRRAPGGVGGDAAVPSSDVVDPQRPGVTHGLARRLHIHNVRFLMLGPHPAGETRARFSLDFRRERD
jgi:hypothetical protein